MKKHQHILKTVVVLSGVAMVVSCATDKTDSLNPKTADILKKGRMTIVATQADFEGDTRTALDEDKSVDWVDTDLVGVFIHAHNADGELYPTLNAPFAIADMNTETGSATFTGEFIECEGTVETVDYYVYHPYHENCGEEPTAAEITLPTTQHPTASSFDGAADVMFGKASTVGTLVGKNEYGGDINFTFTRPFSLGKFTFTNIPAEVTAPENETVYSVKFTFDGGLNLAGDFTVDLTADTKEIVPVDMTNVITLDYSNQTIKLNNLTAYWIIAPATVTTMTVEIVTTNHTITKSFTGKNLQFKPNAINSGAVSLTGASSVLIGDVMSRISDPVFKAFLEEQMTLQGWDANADGALSPEEALVVRTLDVTGLGIASLAGLEYFTKLVTLRCSSNELASLDVDGNADLVGIDCSTNKIPSLNLSKNLLLRNLYCNNNGLTSLDVTANTALRNLYCYNNKITALDVTHNASLQMVQCYGNKIEELDVTHNPSLTILDCGDNALSSLDVTANPLLTELYCYSNTLTSLDVTTNTALTSLECYGNGLSTLDVTQNTALTNLLCYSNSLTSIDVAANTALEHLNCFDNLLTELDVTGNTSLVLLYFNDNPGNGVDTFPVKAWFSGAPTEAEFTYIDWTYGDAVISPVYSE
jgi:hypothetical protein